jgi:hypothetical protein
MSDETLSSIVEAAARRGTEAALRDRDEAAKADHGSFYHVARRGIMAVLDWLDKKYGKVTTPKSENA